MGFANASSDHGSASGLAMGANLQYGWFYDGGFNLGLGGGIQYLSLDYSNIGLGTISGRRSIEGVNHTVLTAENLREAVERLTGLVGRG